jgi:hypothetical protein
LTIHAQDGRVGRIIGECISHIKLFSAQSLLVRIVV